VIFLNEINDLAAQNARLHRGRRRQDTGFDEQLEALKDVKAVEKRSKTSGELVACHGCGVFRSIGSSIESDGHVHTQAKRCLGHRGNRANAQGSSGTIHLKPDFITSSLVECLPCATLLDLYILCSSKQPQNGRVHASTCAAAVCLKMQNCDTI
jgi:hypothetical protein